MFISFRGVSAPLIHPRTVVQVRIREFSNKKINLSAFSGNKLFRFWVMTFPAELNNLSEGTLVAIMENHFWIEVHRSLVIVQLLHVDSSSSTFPRTAMYFSGITLVEKCVRCGNLNLGSAKSSSLLKLDSSTMLMGCNPWQIKSAVAPTSSFIRLLSLVYGTAQFYLWNQLGIQSVPTLYFSQLEERPAAQNLLTPFYSSTR